MSDPLETGLATILGAADSPPGAVIAVATESGTASAVAGFRQRAGAGEDQQRIRTIAETAAA